MCFNNNNTVFVQHIWEKLTSSLEMCRNSMRNSKCLTADMPEARGSQGLTYKKEYKGFIILQKMKK